MKLHPREQRTNQATNEIEKAILDIWQKYELTDGEYLRAVSVASSRCIGSIAKYMIRAERHPDDPEKPGGLE